MTRKKNRKREKGEMGLPKMNPVPRKQQKNMLLEYILLKHEMTKNICGWGTIF